jgi:hypothetical protein
MPSTALITNLRIQTPATTLNEHVKNASSGLAPLDSRIRLASSSLPFLRYLPSWNSVKRKSAEASYFAKGFRLGYIWASRPSIFITILPPISFWDSLSEKNCTFCRGGVIYNELVKRQNKQRESNDSEGIRRGMHRDVDGVSTRERYDITCMKSVYLILEEVAGRCNLQ